MRTVLCLLVMSMYAGAANLSKDIFKKVPFSKQYIEDGAIIKNVDFHSISKLKSIIEKKYSLKLNGRKLVDRNEAHITIITPPEAQGWFHPNKKGLNSFMSPEDMLNKYKKKINEARFKVECLGMREDKKSKKIVYFLVISSSDIMTIREDIYDKVEKIRSSKKTKNHFKPNEYYPHITIGFIGGDIHNQTKGKESCVDDIKLI